jgi:hypothetical protein
MDQSCQRVALKLSIVLIVLADDAKIFFNNE